MTSSYHQVLMEHNLAPAQWAILSTASLFLAVPTDRFLIEAKLESAEGFTEDELRSALFHCLQHKWVSCTTSFANRQTVNAIILTDSGNDLKEVVSIELFETVELV